MQKAPLIKNNKGEVYNFQTERFVKATGKIGKDIIAISNEEDVRRVKNQTEAKEILKDFIEKEDIQIKIEKKKKTAEIETQTETEMKEEQPKKQMKEMGQQTESQVKQIKEMGIQTKDTDLDKLLKVLVANLVKKPELTKSILQPSFSEVKQLAVKQDKRLEDKMPSKPKPVNPIFNKIMTQDEKPKPKSKSKPVKEITVKGKKCKCKD